MNKINSNWLSSLKKELESRQLVVVANREPYTHEHDSMGRLKIVRPASGLVTALEPILKEFGGLWIAHGNGTADFDVTNHFNEVKVPPENPRYVLKRVFLSKEEETGYYYGFSNEGLWPLCHLAHNRPTFRLSDWEQYQIVNERFSHSIPENLEENALILVQDYHFALLPQLLKKRQDLKKNKIGLFWHIPWPNSEAFGICPWHQDLLKGMLGADVIGFHIRSHCNNFLETCNRYLEARIDWENDSVIMDNHITSVRAIPIGIDSTPVPALSDIQIHQLKKQYRIKTPYVAVGVDRLDYTKGLIERMEGVERFFEKYPQYIEKFTLAQLGSPSRMHIPAYQFLSQQLESVVNRVNYRFGRTRNDFEYRPIVFLPEHHSWNEIQCFYQIGDVCLVTSLHDGMNLVAKEYVWCQQSHRGSLVLSQFTGASRELTEAFIVNPYSTEEIADAILGALTLSEIEKNQRMLTMKQKIENRSALHWAAEFIQILLSKNENDLIPHLKLDHEGISRLKVIR